ncbi:hypothetical protein DC522_03155 [Microvirga sp. KLBC 81]|uniref:hypothetical protein n=1 Tax=Microvirga sp. KLBC 81 TaxID=1862707 RepID=UPI000D5130D6|nr:hypothetical protein [Microvirga sp. KLBC 81]PVE25785.1 hypothetical protein DC522_03155 [Microvirga sp. KLBC 81]
MMAQEEAELVVDAFGRAETATDLIVDMTEGLIDQDDVIRKITWWIEVYNQSYDELADVKLKAKTVDGASITLFRNEKLSTDRFIDVDLEQDNLVIRKFKLQWTFQGKGYYSETVVGPNSYFIHGDVRVLGEKALWGGSSVQS